MRGYLASHFLNEWGLRGTAEFARKIREAIPGIDLYVPQENDSINDKSSNDATITAEKIFLADQEKVWPANILFANLDGVEVDCGVAGELGIFATLMDIEDLLAQEKRNAIATPRIIIGIYSDVRRVGTGENHRDPNLFIKGLVKTHGEYVNSEDEAIEIAKRFIEEHREVIEKIEKEWEEVNG